MGNALIVRAERLAEFPEIGRPVPEFKRPELREIIHRSYRIIYRVRADQPVVEIVRFWHAARGFPQIPSA
jgi:toxin ParE1/3/4